MINLSEKVANSFRNKSNAKANPENPVTKRRRKLYEIIKAKTAGNPDKEYNYSMSLINKNRPKIENYIMSKNEVPLDKVEDLALQAYKLRCNEIDSTSSMMGISEGEANIFLEDDEAETELANNAEADNFIGELFAPIGVAAGHLENSYDDSHEPIDSDSFVDANLVSGIINTIGGKVDKGALKRAAQDKPAGILGFLSGGKKQYELLRTYFRDPKNKDEKDAVLKGIITDPMQLRGYGGAAGAMGNLKGVGILGNDVIDQIAKQKKREAINKALPFIIIGVVVIILVTVLIVRNANKRK